MTKMKKYIIYMLLSAVSLIPATSCRAWLDVDSEDRILEEKLFSSTDGFYTALNGVYVDLVNRDLYSGTLGPLTADVLAQYWNTEADSHYYGSLSLFRPEAKRTAVNGLWTRAYYLILNINKIIRHCDDKKGTVLNDKDFSIIKGEALAMRALLHFELLRYFGPVFSVSAGKDAIPYITEPDPQVNPVLPAISVISKINSDITESIELLEDYDPVTVSGKNDSDNSGRNLYGYRNLRMNCFAVKALGARVNMYLSYLNDYRAQALAYAEEVIRDAAAFFPFSTREEVNGQAATGSVSVSAQDRVLSSDILFAVYNVKRGADIYEYLFSPTLQANRLLAMTGNGYRSLYPEESDLRTYQWAARRDVAGNDVMCLVKYEGMEVDGKSYPYMIPVLRMSEMYLIAAECYAAAGQETLAYERLNTLRNARQTSSVSSAIDAEIENEYAREFAGEGQYFWFCKRKNYHSLSCLYDRSKPDRNVSTADYVFELPQSEGGFRE